MFVKKYAVIGTGHFGAEFARALQEINPEMLEIVYSPGDSCVKLATELGCKFTHNLNDILNDKSINCAIITSPNYLHKEHVLQCASAGKNIFCEKPFALSAPDAKEMIQACETYNVTLMVGHIMHFFDGIKKVKDLIVSGDFGTIMNAHVERTGWENKQSELSWKKMQEKSGGHLFHHIHEIDLIQWFMGMPSKIYAVGGNLAHNEDGFGDEDDMLFLTLSFPNKSVATFQYGSGFRASNHLLRINGTKQGALIDFSTSCVTIYSDNGSEKTDLFNDEASNTSLSNLFIKSDAGIVYGNPNTRPKKYVMNNLRKELKLFCDVIDGKDIPADYKDLFDGTSALNSVVIAQTCLQSRENEKTLYVV